MKPRHRLNSFLEAIAIPHLALYLVMGQAIVYLLLMTRPEIALALPLRPEYVMRGEWWRLFSFVLVPVSMSPLWNFLSWMMLYFVGSALEMHWGTVRFNLFLFIGWLLTTMVAFIVPGASATNIFFVHSVFFAFAFIAPELEMMVFFVLPVKVKWLALILWLTYALEFAKGSFPVRLSILAAVGNFLIFFWRDILQRIRGRGRRIAHAQRMRAEEPQGPRHTCVICGKNSTTHPELDFRYCSKCAGEQCYCPEHIRNHEHVLEQKSPHQDKDAAAG